MRVNSSFFVASTVVVAAAAAVWGAGMAQLPTGTERVVQIKARRFSYSPDVIELEAGVPAVIELTSLDREHGFTIPDLGLRLDVEPGETSRVRIVPEKVGTFPFHCDIFCGSGHEEMAGRIIVVPARRSQK